MADLDQAFMFVMTNEDSTLSGMVSPEPDNAKARFGVNSKAHPEAVAAGFYEMSKEDALSYAKDVFQKDYWDEVWGDKITDQSIANKVVDLSFNLNPMPAVKITQRAVNYMATVKMFVDGVMGKNTLKAINQSDPEKLLGYIKSYAKMYYQDIAFSKPELSKYLNGWLARVQK